MDRELWLKTFIEKEEDFKKAREALEARDRIYELAFEEGPLPMIMLNENLEFIEVNKRASALLGQVLYDSLEGLIDDASVQDFNHYKEELTCKNRDGQVHLWFTIDNEKKYIRMTITPLGDKLYQAILIDESFTKEKIEHLEIKGFKDYLTQIYNRRFFHEEIQRLDVKRNYPLGLIIADLNGLKLVNDAFGHSMGDCLIKEVASVLKATCRSDDIVARIGGDEFAVIVPLTETVEMENLLDRIKREVARRQVKDVQLSLAIGYSIKTSAKEDYNHFFKRAEDLMYKDKLLNSSSQRVEIINGILSTLHEKHPREKAHSEAVSQYMVAFAKAMSFGAARITKVESASLLHDIGKIAIDYRLLEEDRDLNQGEMALVRTHAEIGYRILKNTVTFGDIAEIVLYHHERVDGRGYPRGLKGSEIPLESRMLSICDSYDAMVSNDFYRQALSKDQAVEEMKKCSGHQFDPLLLDIFISKVIDPK